MVMIRLAGRGDVEALRAIAAAAYAQYIPRIGRAPAPVTPADYARAVRGEQAWAAAEDGRVAGLRRPHRPARLPAPGQHRGLAR